MKVCDAQWFADKVYRNATECANCFKLLMHEQTVQVSDTTMLKKVQMLVPKKILFYIKFYCCPTDLG